LFFLFYIVVALVAGFPDGVIGTFDYRTGWGVLGTIATLGLLIPSIAVGVRRLHDTDKSGWWMLLSVVPIANLVLLVFFCLDGTKGENRFGPDPKADERVAEDVRVAE